MIDKTKRHKPGGKYDHHMNDRTAQQFFVSPMKNNTFLTIAISK